jgi:hypothetical protein
MEGFDTRSCGFQETFPGAENELRFLDGQGQLMYG